MNILIKSATIIDSDSPYHQTTQDLLIEKGRITKIAKSLKKPPQCDLVIALENLHLSQGWFDSSVCFGEPGYEDRETLTNGLRVAALSGFTAVAMNANTNPIVDTNTAVGFVLSKAQGAPVKLLPIAALTRESKGESLAELYDMHSAGASAFYDYKAPVLNPNMMKIALQYSRSFEGLICSFPQESQIAQSGVINEHVTSTKLGLKGNPALAETLQIARDLYLLEYAGGKLHIPTISTRESVTLIRTAKAKGLDVTCSVAIHNLCFTDEALFSFDTNLKVLPPLRTPSDVEALVDGLKDGTIDMVTSDHCPITIEDKKTEFDHAQYGTIGLESAFGALQTHFDTAERVALLTQGKKRFGLKSHPIAVGNKAIISLFDPDKRYAFNKNMIESKSKNAIFEGHTLTGKSYGIIAHDTYQLNTKL